ncbi:MAG TPA: DUF6587 family protein [Dokdonella sp.]|uniref:DUF6587 family protein n=1 Tax=Dokdonella sp. TaxID=2291710 RepID=UPI002D7EC9AE|nr:DUF6587 family protein [Dokdonella sp.]HET9033545.1 DUF6587 family protein [Dokdonella sp.]
MSAQVLQTILVAAIVSVSTILGARHIAPGPFRSLQSSLARSLGNPQRGTWLRVLGRWLQPREAKQGSCGSGLGCASCGGCGTSEAKPADSIPLKFRPHSSQ